MWDIPRLYALACSNSCQLVPLHPIIISILFHHYKELKECISEVEQMEEARVSDNSSKKNGDLAPDTRYYNPEQKVLQHYRYPNIFIRRTKAIYISVVDDSIVETARRIGKAPLWRL